MKQQPGTEVLRPKVRKRYGAAVPHYKNTENRKSTVMPPPETVTLLMQQHIGPACKTTVKPGDAVKVGEVVGDSDAYRPAPIHASVSGTVKAIKQVMLPSGQMSEAVVIESDGKMEPFEGLRPPQAGGAGDGGARLRARGSRRRGLSHACEAHPARRGEDRYAHHQRGGMRALHHLRPPGDPRKCG